MFPLRDNLNSPSLERLVIKPNNSDSVAWQIEPQLAGHHAQHFHLVRRRQAVPSYNVAHTQCCDHCKISKPHHYKTIYLHLRSGVQLLQLCPIRVRRLTHRLPNCEGVGRAHVVNPVSKRRPGSRCNRASSTVLIVGGELCWGQAPPQPRLLMGLQCLRWCHLNGHVGRRRNARVGRRSARWPEVGDEDLNAVEAGQARRPASERTPWAI